MAGCCGGESSRGAPFFVKGEGSKVRFYGKNQLLVLVRIDWVQYTINNQVYFGTPEEDPSYYLPGYTFVGWKIDGVEGTPRSYMLPKGSYGNRTATMLWEPIP